MAQKFALARVREIADHQTEAAAARLARLNREVQEQASRLTMLLRYREEYRARLQRSAAGGLDAAAMRNYHEFMQRLEQAVRQQQAMVDEARARAEHGRLEWQTRRRKSMAFDSLSRRHDLRVQRQDSLREQKSQDEFAQRHALKTAR